MKNSLLQLVASKLINGQWAINDENYIVLSKLINNYINNVEFGNSASVVSNRNEFKVSEFADDDGIAVVYLNGVLIKAGLNITEEEEMEMGICNIDKISELLDEVAEDKTVTTICLFFDSPGGEVTGIPELARKIAYINDNEKPVIGWTESSAGSAAYWLMSQCGFIGCTESSNIGAVGVYTLLENHLEKLKKEGIEIIPFSSGKYKLIGQKFHVLSDEERNMMNENVSNTNKKFKQAIKLKRNIADEYLEGFSFSGDKAVEYGFADAITDSFSNFITANIKI